MSICYFKVLRTAIFFHFCRGNINTPAEKLHPKITSFQYISQDETSFIQKTKERPNSNSINLQNQQRKNSLYTHDDRGSNINNMNNNVKSRKIAQVGEITDDESKKVKKIKGVNIPKRRAGGKDEDKNEEKSNKQKSNDHKNQIPQIIQKAPTQSPSIILAPLASPKLPSNANLDANEAINENENNPLPTLLIDDDAKEEDMDLLAGPPKSFAISTSPSISIQNYLDIPDALEQITSSPTQSPTVVLTQPTSNPTDSMSQSPSISFFHQPKIQMLAHEVEIPSFTIILSLTESNIDEELLVEITEQHMSVVFSQNIYFHRLDLMIENSKRKRSLQRRDDGMFVFSGSAWYIERKFIPVDLQSYIDESFDDYYIQSYTGALRLHGIDIMSIEVGATLASGNNAVNSSIPQQKKRKLPKIATVFIIFAASFCVIVFIFYMMHQRDRAGIDYDFDDEDDDDYSDEFGDGMINLEVKVVKKYRKKKKKKERSNDIFRPQTSKKEDVEVLLNDVSFNSGGSSIEFLEPDVSVITTDSFMGRKRLS